jgi:hypothetical protein
MDLETALLHNSGDDQSMTVTWMWISICPSFKVCSNESEGSRVSVEELTRYGLKQAGHAWFHKMDNTLFDLSCTALASVNVFMCNTSRNRC